MKRINSILEKQISLIRPDEKSIEFLKRLTNNFIKELNDELLKTNIDAKAFVGGSFARGTLVKTESYDIDIFVRFDWKYEKISDLLFNVLKNVCKNMKLRLVKVHGSRDYFKVYPENRINSDHSSSKNPPSSEVNKEVKVNGQGNGYFEIIPVTKIKKPSEERNITDLSFFHVPYVKKRIKSLEDQVRLAKVFFKAQKVYGAETYVRGFSGYSLELLIIYYKSFLKMLKGLTKGEKGERKIIDIENHYKKKDEVFIEMNESKINNPIILVDPTYKERNVLAALSFETFEKFQEAAKKFLKNPKFAYFVKKEINISKLKKKAESKKANFLHLKVITKRQEGDIAGTKLKKFSDLLIEEIGKYYLISDYEFEYGGKQTGDIYLIAKSKGNVVRIGPPVHLKKFVRAFEKEHMKTYVKNRMVHAKIKINFSVNSYLDVWRKTNKRKIKDMGIDKLWIEKD